MTASGKIKVLVVDDSAVFRELLARELEKDVDFEVMGRAADPIIAKKLIAQSRPDVLTLDVEMPRQDGLSFLAELMRTTPLPVVMVSSLTEAGCEATLRAFELGAVDAIAKPHDGDTASLGQRVRDAVRAAAHAQPRVHGHAPAAPPAHSTHEPGGRTPSGRLVAAPGASETPPGVPVLPPPVRTQTIIPPLVAASRIVAIGASTGGTEALKTVFRALPSSFPPIVVVQHMPEGFTGAFARSLSAISKVEVVEAGRQDVPLRPGIAVLAHGGLHLYVERKGEQLVAEVREGPPVRNHKPSVDVLFTSVAKAAGNRALAVLLTGMGDDGARGMLKIREAGGRTFAQDQASCVVYGMPKRAVELGAAERTVDLERMGAELVRTIASPSRAGA